MTERGVVARPRAEPGPDGTLAAVTQEEAGWQYVSFKVWRLKAGQAVEDDTGDEEIGLVVLSGTITLRSSAGSWEKIGERKNVFEGKPYVVYLPPRVSFTLDAVTDCEVARAGTKAERGVEAKLIRPEEIKEDVRGQGNAQRFIRHVLETDRDAERLLLVEVITPSGNWSSYPPHKHDTNNPPQETYLEETYYHRIQPPQGFGFQRIYAQDRSLDEAVVIEDGTIVMVPRGYHPTVVAPGYTLYYLNVMAGPVRKWLFTDDPDHRWVAESWR